MKFSVVVPAYNVDKHIKNLLECLLQQTYIDFEVIVVDDCATDTTGAIADQMCTAFSQKGIQYRVIHKPVNEGLSMARNTGIDEAMGEYILFLDGDDTVEPVLLETVVKALASSDSKMIDLVVYGYSEDYYVGDKLSYQEHKLPVNGIYEGDAALDYIARLEAATMFGYAWNKAYRLEFLREQGMRYEKVTHIEDVLFNIEVAKHMTGMCTIAKELYHYRNGGQVRLTTKYLPEYFPLQKRRIESFLSLVPEAREMMAGAYFRSFQSFIVREIVHGTKKDEILRQVEEEYKSELYVSLQNSLNATGKVTRILYLPLAQQKSRAAYRRANYIAWVQKNCPGIYARLKQHR